MLFFFVFLFFCFKCAYQLPRHQEAKYELGVFGVPFPCKGHRRGKYVVALMKWGGGGGGGNPTFILFYGFHYAYELTRSVG